MDITTGHKKGLSKPLTQLRNFIFKFVNSIRRGFKVWLKSCQSCHGAFKQKYDVLVDKAYSQQELIGKMKDTPPIHPAHQMRRAFYFNEWDYRQRLIHDRMWSTYLTRDRNNNLIM